MSHTLSYLTLKATLDNNIDHNISSYVTVMKTNILKILLLTSSNLYLH